MLLRTAIYLAALVLPRSARTAGTCFLPDGSKDKNDLPCFSNNTTSRCCAPDQFCSTNKLCVLNEGGPRYARGSCLDKTFGSTCPNFCKSIKDNSKVDLFPCGDPSLGTFCCDEGNGKDCCSTSSKLFTLGVGTTFIEGATSSIIKFSMSKSPVVISQVPLARTKTTIINLTTTTVPVSTRTSVQVVTSIQVQTSIVTSIQVQSSSQAPISSPIFFSQVSIATSIGTAYSSAVFANSSKITSFLTSIIIPPSSTSRQPTTLSSQSFTDLPSPVFTSIFVPTPTSRPSRTSRSKSTIATSSSSGISASSSPTNTTSIASEASAVAASNPITESSISSANSAPNRISIAIIISASIGGAIVLILIIAFIFVLRRQRKERLLAGGIPFQFRKKYSKDTNENGSTRSGSSGGFSQKTAFGYRPTQQDSNNSARRPMNISVPIVYRGNMEGMSDAGGAPVQRLSSTTYQSRIENDGPNTERRRMTPGSDFNIYTSPTRIFSPATTTDKERGMTRVFTPEDLNRVAGTGYGRNVVPMEIEGMEKPIDGRSMSTVSQRSAIYQKLLFDVRSQPF